ncbi:hypothetical protein M5K25_009447 [Dendrobium thyrsiflorum]|uniref:Helicase MOV-10-like beta-barrel domain-containing protein n=1 Tax=Dendrobium thyrsiflorum TaxID=117978 RepID=A0ABD0V5H8_DENTH
MFLLDALRRILGHGREKQEQDSLNPAIPRSTEPLQDRLYHDEPRPPLCRLPPAYTSSSAKGSNFLAPQSEASSSKKPSLPTVSSTNSPISKAPVRVWQAPLPSPPDSTTKLAEKPSLSSPTLPSSRKVAVSHAPPDSTTNNSVSWQKNKQISTVPSRESVQNLPAFSPSLIKFVRPDSFSSSNTSPSSLLESGISNRRVLPKYEIPKYLEEMIRNDSVPPVLKRPLSPSTYSDFFATLLYAEDFYAEASVLPCVGTKKPSKWSEYLLRGIKLELQRRTNSKNSEESSMKRKNTMLVQRDFVAFQIDSVPERRPYLLSRDFVFLKPLNEFAGPFKGILFRVTKGVILVEFGDDFHSQHSPSKRYDVSFSFNRVCLKRAHQAISVASDPSFHNILFPDQTASYHPNTSHFIPEKNHVRKILNHKGPIPFLVNGQLVQDRPSDQNHPSTGLIIQVALVNLYRTNPRCRILLCAPTNDTSDVLLRSLKKQIPDSSLFRANAAYRDYDLVPDDIIPASLYEEDGECFACPPLAELKCFNIITCTFMSSFRLYAAGLDSEHFTHIFLVNASLATEPEAIVPLAHFVGRNTIVVVNGCSDKSPYWVRADIARKHGLKVSYFNRLLAREPYLGNDSMFIAHLA